MINSTRSASVNESISPWVINALRGCFLYYLLAGIWLILEPTFLFELSNIPPPNYPWLAQIAGLMTAIFGFVFFLCSRSPTRTIEFIYIGLAAQILLPIFTLNCWRLGSIPTSAALSLASVDIAWALVLGFCISNLKSKAPKLK